jgi:hypothetical protein
MIRIVSRPRRLALAFAAALALAASAAACSDPQPPVTPTPVAATITETFSGTVTVQSQSYHTFTIKEIGGVKVSLTDVNPGAALGIGVGTPSAATGTCLVINSTTAVAGQTVLISGTATVPGNFCVSIFDIGNLVETVNYTIVVFHS